SVLIGISFEVVRLSGSTAGSLAGGGPGVGLYPPNNSVWSNSVILSPAATTAAACSRPGERVSRSIGPDTETAASTRPAGPRTGADTVATPGSRSAAVATQPRRRTWASVVAVNFA